MIKCPKVICPKVNCSKFKCLNNKVSEYSSVRKPNLTYNYITLPVQAIDLLNQIIFDIYFGHLAFGQSIRSRKNIKFRLPFSSTTGKQEKKGIKLIFKNIFSVTSFIVTHRFFYSPSF